MHFAVERRLIALLGPVGKKLHTGRSRNDQVGTDLRLWLRRRIDELDPQVKTLQQALLRQALNHRQTLIPGYTHHSAPSRCAWLIIYLRMWRCSSGIVSALRTCASA